MRIHDNALVAAATLSNRYITDRFLPDKAIDLSLIHILLAAEVRREDDDRVLEVHRAALTVRDTAVVQDLQQDVCLLYTSRCV